MRLPVPPIVKPVLGVLAAPGVVEIVPERGVVLLTMSFCALAPKNETGAGNSISEPASVAPAPVALAPIDTAALVIALAPVREVPESFLNVPVSKLKFPRPREVALLMLRIPPLRVVPPSVTVAAYPELSP